MTAAEIDRGVAGVVPRPRLGAGVRYHPSPMFGSHLSVAGGLVNALHEARRLRMDCVQVFTRNQRQWTPSPLTDEERRAWLEELAAMGWHRTRGPVRVVSHNSYLVNLASPDPAQWRRSVAAA